MLPSSCFWRKGPIQRFNQAERWCDSLKLHRQKHLQCCKRHFPSGCLRYHSITDQQRLAGPSGPIVPNPCSSRNSQQGAQHQVQAASEDLRGGDPSAAWQPELLLCHLHSTELLPVFRGDLLCSNLYPLPLVLALGTSETNPALSSLHPPSGIYAHCEIPLNFPFSRLYSLPMPHFPISLTPLAARSEALSPSLLRQRRMRRTGVWVQPLRRMCDRLRRLRSVERRRRRVCSLPGAGAAGRGRGANGGGAALCCGGSSRSSATPVLSPRAAACSTRCARAGRRVSTAPGKARARPRHRGCSGKRAGPASLPARCVAGRSASSR